MNEKSEKPKLDPIRWFLGTILGGIISAILLSAPLFLSGYLLTGAIVWIVGCLLGAGIAFATNVLVAQANNQLDKF